MTTAVATIAEPGRDPETRTSRVNASLGMALFIGSWSMAFGTMFLSYFIMRHRVDVWPPQDVALPSLPLAALGTGILAASSLALHRGMRRLAAGQPRAASLWNLGLLLGLSFATLQYFLWADLMAAGRLPSTGMYETIFYALTWFHAAHVLCGLIGLIWVSVGMARGRYHASRTIVPGNIAIFWHFVDAVWVVLFITFFMI